MTLQSGFFTSLNRDRLYKAEFFTSYFSSFIGNGVFPNPSNNLQVVAAQNLNVNVSPGKGWINGHYLRNDANYTLTLAPADGVLNRIDRIVFAVNFDTRNIEVYTKQGVLSANPVAPTLTRSATVYELGLADIRINAGTVAITQAQITDLRPNASLCGIVSGTVNQVDVTTLYNQYAAQFEQMTVQQQAQFNQFIADLQDILDGDVAANLANRILALENTTSDIDGRVTQHTTQIATLTANNQKATQAEAIAGTNNTKNMTPLRVNEAITNKSLLKTGGDLTGNIRIVNEAPIITLTETGGSEFLIVADANTFSIRKNGSALAYPINIDANENVFIGGISIQELFQSVSNGKAQVASAITDKGVTTASNATFATLANNVSQISTGPQTAMGTAPAPNTITATLQDGTTESGLGLVTVTGLGFTPRKIKLYRNDGTYFYETNYDATNPSPFNGALMSIFTSNANNNRTLNINPNTAPCYVRQGEFALPVQTQGQTYNWYAEA